MPVGSEKYTGGAFESSKGTKGRRRRRAQVAGPYRSQSSNPKIRSEATESERRTVATTPSNPVLSPVPPAFTQGYTGGRHVDQSDFPSLSPLLSALSLLSDDNAITGTPGRDLVEDEMSNLVTAVEQNYDPERIGKAPTPEQTRALLTIATALPGPSGASTLAKALRASESAVSGATTGRALARLAQRAPAVRAAAKGAAKQAERIPAPIRKGAAAAAKVGSYPVRHPIQAPLAAQAPVAAYQGDPDEMLKALTGQSVYAGIMGQAAGALGGIPGEAVSLPAAIVPSVYLTGKAGVEAAQGDPTEAEGLLEEWEETGLLPAVARGVSTGDWSGVGDAFGDHPLYAGLEASGAVNAAGRLAGAGLRAVPGKDWASRVRDPLTLPGTKIEVQREYSRDALRQLVQRGVDKRRGSEIKPGSQRAAHYEKQAANRFTTDQETTRRLHARERMEELQEILPKKWLGGRKIDRKAAEAVPLAVERILQDPATFADDLPTYKKLLDWAAKDTDDNGRPRLNKEQLKRNRENSRIIEDAMKGGKDRVEKTVKAADAFIEMQRPILDEMVELGLMTPERAAFASAIPWARVHLGAKWGKTKDDGEETLLDRDGNAIPIEAVTAAMQRRGVEPPGFLGHRAPSAGDFYKPPFGGATLDKGSRSGESVLAGMQQGGIEGLVRQMRRSQGLVDRARSWNEAISQFGIQIGGVKTWSDARRVMEDPAHFGIPEGQELMAVPRHPFTANKDEMEGALSHQDPVAVDEGAGAYLNQQIDALNNGQLPDDTPIAFVPKKVGQQLRADADPSGQGLKAVQAATNVFKRAVLPFSPSFYIGNVFDNYTRTLMAGINPVHVGVGIVASRALPPERREQLMPGALYGSVDRLSPHRSVENVVTGSGSVARTMREAAEWTHKQGYKQAAVKFAPKAVSETSRFLMATNRLVSERLPSYGVLGKAVAKDIRKTQGSWMKAVLQHEKAIKGWAKGVDDPATRIKLQRDMEEALGNYSQMSPAARKVLSNVVPFWTWMRSAYKYVYLTMPAHRSIQTGLLTAMAAATQVEREQLGLQKGQGEGELDSWQQGGVPVGEDKVIPMAGYNSFGYAADPLEAISKSGFAQFKGVIDSLGGVDWRGEPIPQDDRLSAAILASAGGFLPGFNQLFDVDKGALEFNPSPSLPKPYDAYEAEDKILVPTGGDDSSGGGGIWRSTSSGSTGVWR